MTSLARVTVDAPHRRLDVGLPEHLPVAELLPELLRYAGAGLADDGERHGGWLLRRVAGSPLRPDQSLAGQGIRDGEILHLVPARLDWPELEYDDVVEAIAAAAGRHGSAWTAAASRAVSLAVGIALLATGAVACLRAGPGPAAFVALAAAGLLTLAGTIASRAYADAAVGAGLAGSAQVYGVAGGALLLPREAGTGVVAALPWLGGPELLLGAAALVLVAVLGGVGVGTGDRVFAAGVTAGLLGCLAGGAGLFLPAGGAAAVLLVVLVGGIGAVPLIAIRSGRLPVPAVTLPTGVDRVTRPGPAPGGPAGRDDEPAPASARPPPSPGQVSRAVARTEDVLAGMLIGVAVPAAGASLVLVLSGGAAGRVLVAVAGAALLLRARLFIAVAQRLPLLLAGLAGATVLAAERVTRADRTGLLVAAVGTVAAAVMIIIAGTRYARRAPSPYLGRAADVLDTLLVISVVPVAAAVLGLYAKARGLAG